MDEVQANKATRKINPFLQSTLRFRELIELCLHLTSFIVPRDASWMERWRCSLCLPVTGIVHFENNILDCCEHGP